MTHTESNGLKKYLIGLGISITSTLLVQSGALLWWAGKVEARVSTLEQHCVEMRGWITNHLMQKPTDPQP